MRKTPASEAPFDLDSLLVVTRPNPEDGLPLFSAKNHYASAALKKQFSDLSLNTPLYEIFPGELRTKVMLFRGALDLHQLSLLREGKCYAIYQLPGEHARHLAQPAEWHFATLNEDGESATINGVVLKNVLVFDSKEAAERFLRPALEGGGAESAPPPMLQSRRTHPRGGKNVELAFKEWVNERGGNAPTKREAEAWAKSKGFSTSVVRKLHSALRAREPGRPRRPDKKGQQ